MENIFQRPPILMRLTMLTRDKMSLLRAASLRTAWETARGLNDRKQRGLVEAGILPTESLPLKRREPMSPNCLKKVEHNATVLHYIKAPVFSAAPLMEAHS